MDLSLLILEQVNILKILAIILKWAQENLNF